MKKAKSFLLASGALLILVSALALVTQSPSQSQGGFSTLPVTVMNGSTLPVPVVGSVGITGTPTVGINGTPTVGLAPGSKIGIDPASNNVSVTSLPAVQLATTAANPALVRDVDASARQPFQGEISVKVADGAITGTGVVTFPDGTTKVPAGKLLLIKEVTAGGNAAGPTAMTANLVTTVGNRMARHFIVMQNQGGGSAFAGASHFAGSQPMEVYADPGTQVGAAANFDFPQPAGEVLVATVAGYLVNAP